MLALALALLSALGPEDLDLPRSLSVELPPPKEQFSIWIGGHLGVAGAYDADNPAFAIGANVRTQFLPWLGADGSIDFQTKQEVDGPVKIFQVPFMMLIKPFSYTEDNPPPAECFLIRGFFSSMLNNATLQLRSSFIL